MLYMPPRSIPDPSQIHQGRSGSDLLRICLVAIVWYWTSAEWAAVTKDCPFTPKGRMLLLTEFLGRMDSAILCPVLSSRMMFNYRFRPSG